MSAPPPDDRLGPYRLLRELGRGGQAVVWLAEDPRIGRKVALKVLPALGPGSEGILKRFQREASVTSQLEHPAICPVYEADLQGGVPYIAMRYVEGETLARRVARTRDAGGRAVVLRGTPPQAPDWNGIATFFARTARALHLAHEAGVLHRDIQPANLMVTPEGEPVILDFGLARQDDPETPSLSLSGEHSGTPAYMSPEQMTGRQRPDRRSDVYSLGCALFESLTGRAPFEAATLEALFHAVLMEDAPGVRAVHTAVPEDLAVITATAIEKERDRRYKSALDLALDLERFTSLLPIQARPITRTQRLTRWSRRNPALAASLLAVFLLLVVATGLLSYGVGASGRATLEAELRQHAEQERQRMVQAAADKDLAGRMDELGMKLGVLRFGYGGGPAALVTLVPEFLRLLREAGVTLDGPDPVAAAAARIETLRARDPEAARVLLALIHNLSEFVQVEPAMRQTLRALDQRYLDPRMAEMIRVHERWVTDRVDEFAPLLTRDALASLEAEQMALLARLLMDVDGRDKAWPRLMERALLKRPDSFAIQFASAGMSIRLAADDLKAPAAERLVRDAVQRFAAAVALRPRSGLARAALASAMALLGYATGDQTTFAPAWATMQSATEVDPDNEVVWYFAADFLRRTPTGRSEAIAACRKALALQPRFAPAQQLLDELTK